MSVLKQYTGFEAQWHVNKIGKLFLTLTKKYKNTVRRQIFLSSNVAEWRAIYKKLMFDPGLLESEAKRNPRLSKELGNFCRKQYEAARSDSDLLHAAYFLRLNQYYMENMQQIFRQDPSIDFNRDDFLDSQAILMSHIKEKNQDTSLNNLLFRDLIRTYLFKDAFNNESELSWLIIAHIYRQQHAQVQYFEQDIENEIAGILIQHKAAISRYLKEDRTPLTEIVKFFLPQFNDVNSIWQENGDEYSFHSPAFQVQLNIACPISFI